MPSVPHVELPRPKRSPWVSAPGKPESQKSRNPGFLKSLFALLLLFAFIIAFGLHFARQTGSPPTAPARADVSPSASPAPALVGTPDQRAQAEAHSYLYPCPVGAKFCPSQQKRFVDSYILSWAGQTYFMGDVIGFLDPMQSAAEPGIRVDRIKACAWRFVRWKLSTVAVITKIYDHDWTASCVNREDLDQAAQKAAILALVADLKAGPVTITPRLAAIRDRYAPEEPLAAAIIERYLATRPGNP
jgi:hypothetical protein